MSDLPRQGETFIREMVRPGYRNEPVLHLRQVDEELVTQPGNMTLIFTKIGDLFSRVQAEDQKILSVLREQINGGNFNFYVSHRH
ncbi:hypothetical protein F2P81_020457 [Scophthalmus maximus]|uniref:Uncharacterized protein n=1 Tax=Scophthalmus maximus TaxID=52904 RepID=A0A6A4RY34_SCOMX|nr:hypothetical protein F2P81_020457 [Scophthalmus maximus]